MLTFLCDRKVLFGIGTGIIIATIVMATQKSIISLSKKEIETQAYSYGMRYPSDMKVTESGGVNK